LTTPAIAQPNQDRYPFMHDGWGAGTMIFGGFAMILFWVVTIAVIVLLVRRLAGAEPLSRRERMPSKTPLDILKERFAKGEIDKNEYEERRKILSENAGVAAAGTLHNP
jgi:putative membrane protein